MSCRRAFQGFLCAEGAGNGKAIALGEPDGLVKTIFDAKAGKLLGVWPGNAEVGCILLPLAGEGGPRVGEGRMRAMPERGVVDAAALRPSPSSDPTSSGHLLPPEWEKERAAMNCETTEDELMTPVFPHLTLSEMTHGSVVDACGQVIHN